MKWSNLETQYLIRTLSVGILDKNNYKNSEIFHLSQQESFSKRLEYDNLGSVSFSIE